MRCPIRHTDHCPQFHQRLIELARNEHICHSFHQFSQFPLHRSPDRLFHNIRIIRTHTGDHAKYISIYCRHRLVIGNGRYRPCCIAADSFEFQQFLIRLWDNPIVCLHDLNSRCIEVTHPVIIAEPFPQFQIPVLRTFCQRFYIRQLCDETLKIWFHSLHTRLLQHNF